MGMLNPRGWLGIAATIVLAAALSACGGSDGDTGPKGDPGEKGEQGDPGPAGPAGSGTVNLAALTPEQWAATEFKGAISSVVIASPPVVTFTLTDKVGNPVVGLENVKSLSAGNTIATYPNLSFALAKLEPRTDAKPSTWVSYIVTTVSNVDGAITGATRPSTDNNGTLEAVSGSPGTYKYTFRRDITTVKADVDKLTFSGNNRKEDLGDLDYASAATLPHRLVLQFSGAAPGTGTNTSNGVAVTPAVNLENALNVAYDFKPGAAGAPGTAIPPSELTREDVNIDTCNVCHGKLAFHGGSGRVETRYCVVCHTTQRAYGQAKVTSTKDTTTNGYDSITFPKLKETATVNPATGITSYGYTPETRIADGEVLGNFTTMIHKIHQGHTLVKQNYHYAGLALNNKGFSKLGDGQRMCTTCHDSKVAQTADNHKQLPSRQACGACHDGINFATGGGSTLGDKAAVVNFSDVLKTSGHGAGSIGGPQADDGSCSTCHTPDGIRIAHRMENLTKNNTYILPGLAVFTYEIDSASVNATTNDLTIKFRVLQQIADSTGSVTNVAKTPVTFVAPATTVTNPLTGFSGSPSFLLAHAQPQDGITTNLVDFNNLGAKQGQPRSVSIAALLTTTNAANGKLEPSTDPGYYTATIYGAGGWKFPVGAKMRTVALQGYFTQLNAPVDPQNYLGCVARHAISVMKTVTGDTARRTVVAADKCAGCHEWFEGHGGNRVYETQVCVMCHVPNLATSGRGIADTASGTFPGLNNWIFDIASTKIVTDWGFDKTQVNAALKFPVTTNNFKDMIHGIHAGRERVTPFQDARDRTSTTSAGGGVIQLLDFRRMDFPGKLNNCETCHVTYTGVRDTPGATQTYAVIPSGALVSTYESIDAAYATAIGSGTATPALAKTALNTVNQTDTVTTPFAAACVSCHDNQPARAHMTLNGGSINVPRSVAQPAVRPIEDVESCAVCHGPGREFDTAKVHK